jgi:hypothetical protein
MLIVSTVCISSVTLSPRKTSIWTSAINEKIVAIGCDRKVLLSNDPSSASLLSYNTGSRHGDGAVYALDLTEVGRFKMKFRREMS